jgi:hypothetical protein
MHVRRVTQVMAYPAAAMLLAIPAHVMYGGAWWAVSTVVATLAMLGMHIYMCVREARVDRRNRIAAQQYARTLGYGVHR